MCRILQKCTTTSGGYDTCKFLLVVQSFDNQSHSSINIHCESDMFEEYELAPGLTTESIL